MKKVYWKLLQEVDLEDKLTTFDNELNYVDETTEWIKEEHIVSIDSEMSSIIESFLKSNTSVFEYFLTKFIDQNKHYKTFKLYNLTFKNQDNELSTLEYRIYIEFKHVKTWKN